MKLIAAAILATLFAGAALLADAAAEHASGAAPQQAEPASPPGSGH